MDKYRVNCRGHVYVILHPLGYTKIGVATRVKRRVNEIQACSPIQLFVLGSKEVAKSYELEKYLHEEYRDFRTRGEWFKLSVVQIRELLDFLQIPEPSELSLYEENRELFLEGAFSDIDTYTDASWLKPESNIPRSMADRKGWIT